MADLSANALFNVRGLVVVITGGGSGLGKMAAKALDANGAKAVYIMGRRQGALEAVAAEGVNGSIRPLVGDVTSKESLAAAAKKVADEVGYVNAVFANAGISGVGRFGDLKADFTVDDLQETFWQAPMEDFTETFHVNITSVFFTIMAFLKLLDAGNRQANVTQKSQVVITNSAGSFSRVPAAGFDYSASKAGVMHLGKVLATTLAPFKIRVNCVAPGFFPSEMTAGHKIAGGAADPSAEGSIPTDRIPLGRMGSEKDFAGVMLYLMSEAGAFVDGSVLLTDGGRMALIPSAY